MQKFNISISIGGKFVAAPINAFKIHETFIRDNTVFFQSNRALNSKLSTYQYSTNYCVTGRILILCKRKETRKKRGTLLEIKHILLNLSRTVSSRVSPDCFTIGATFRAKKTHWN